MRAVFLFYVFTGLTFFCSGQDLDSIKSQVKMAPDSERFEIILNHMRQSLNTSPETSLKVSEYALTFALERGDSLLIARALFAKGFILRRLQLPNEAIPIFKRAYFTAKRNNLSTEISKIINSLAVAYSYIGDYDNSLKYHFESLVINEKEKKFEEMSITLNNIGFVYFKLRNFENALKYFSESLEIKERVNSTFDLDRLLINMALCYNQLKKSEIAEEYLTRALKTCGDKCSDVVIMEAQMGLGMAYLEQGKFLESKKFFLKSLGISRKINDKRFESENLISLSSIAVFKDQTDSAINYLQQAELLAKEIGYKQSLVEVYKIKSDIYTNKGDYKYAAFYSKRYSDLRDSIFSEGLIKNIAEIQAKFAERENLATISTKQQIIEQQRYVSILATVVAILSGLLILLIMRVNRITRKLNSKLSEEVYKQTEKLFIAKTNLEKSNRSLSDANDELDNLIYKTSHDLKGPLATLKGICNVALMDVKDEAALGYFLKLDMTSDRLNHVLDRLAVINFLMSAVPTCEEIDLSAMIARILEEKKKIDYKKHIHIETNLECVKGFKSDPVILNHVLESLIDNAFKYHKETQRVESYIKIVANRELTNQVRIRIIDNGIGMNVPKEADVFRLFFRASERSQTGGTGLFIAKTATRKLQGNVTYNHKETAYSEFEITLPLVLDTIKRESVETVEVK